MALSRPGLEQFSLISLYTGHFPDLFLGPGLGDGPPNLALCSPEAEGITKFINAQNSLLKEPENQAASEGGRKAHCLMLCIA